jgi:hypothetical protein
VAPKGVGVQIPPSAPVFSSGLIHDYYDSYDFSRSRLFVSHHRGAAAAW